MNDEEECSRQLCHASAAMGCSTDPEIRNIKIGSRVFFISLPLSSTGCLKEFSARINHWGGVLKAIFLVFRGIVSLCFLTKPFYLCGPVHFGAIHVPSPTTGPQNPGEQLGTHDALAPAVRPILALDFRARELALIRFEEATRASGVSRNLGHAFLETFFCPRDCTVRTMFGLV